MVHQERRALKSGLATEGLKPFLTIYSTFMQRAYDMLIHDIALQRGARSNVLTMRKRGPMAQL